MFSNTSYTYMSNLLYIKISVLPPRVMFSSASYTYCTCLTCCMSRYLCSSRVMFSSASFIWGTLSPVSMLSSTMQGPRSSRMSQGTGLSARERPTETMSPGISWSEGSGRHRFPRYTCKNVEHLFIFRNWPVYTVSKETSKCVSECVQKKVM